MITQQTGFVRFMYWHRWRICHSCISLPQLVQKADDNETLSRVIMNHKASRRSMKSDTPFDSLAAQNFHQHLKGKRKSCGEPTYFIQLLLHSYNQIAGSNPLSLFNRAVAGFRRYLMKMIFIYVCSQSTHFPRQHTHDELQIHGKCPCMSCDRWVETVILRIQFADIMR